MQKIVQKLIDIRVILTVFCVIVSYLTNFLKIDYLVIFGVLTLGIMHGANDLSLLQNIHFMRTKLQRFLIYNLTVIIFSFALYNFPLYALLLFVLFSCYHFGEQQWTHSFQNQTHFPQLFYFLYGGFLFSALFWSHTEQTIYIIKELSDFSVPIYYFQWMTYLFLVLCALFLLFQISATLTLMFDVLFQTALLLALFWTTNLIVSFGTYFIIWHSWPSMKDQIHELYNKPNAYSSYIKDALPYWLISLLGLFLFFIYSDSIGLNPLALFFSFLAAITFPHVLVIFGLHQKIKLS
ncbi:Brp/Blh family beta-carotene 15,15'-dioxygenase [Flavobacteriaceae bacterium]|nr:Brp/Blh family beta-carotene 15,15'-dioxygenase [Flavobacteriaceae bacterium]